MNLAHLNANKMQAWGMPMLDHLNAPNSLTGLLQSFLLACKVDELSPRTLSDYSQKIGAFVHFCVTLKVIQAPEYMSWISP